ncbi:MAG: MarR family transcriptional regulator [Rhodospirillaceae bacterium]|nr:MarR family transcriptional regulator [Rhodospirillaceae bacterium]
MASSVEALGTDENAVLKALFQHAPIQARTLAKRLGLAQSTVFRCLAALEDAGLIAAQSGDDPLRRIISLTAAGEKLKTR